MTVRLILAGGGDPKDSRQLDQFYNKLLKNKRLLFLPQAVAPRLWSYERAYYWLRKNPVLHNVKIRMWKSLEGRSYSELDGFDTIYLMGGNTFQLLHQLQKTGFLQKLYEFIQSGRIVYGISAGAIVLGKDIRTALIGKEADKNTVGLRNLDGLDLLNGYNVHPHYNPINDKELFEHLQERHVPFLAISEKSGVYVKNNTMKAIGYEPVYLFENNRKRMVKLGKTFHLSKS
jgi:dipeptidase E